MAKVYDDWERLVRATLKRDEIWQLCHDHSRTPSSGSTTSGSGASSPIPEVAPPKSSSAKISPMNNQNQRSGVEFKNDKSLRRGKSTMRLDRWIWTRWLSKSFRSQLTDA
ncbi:hypothetical protein BUALT_Bualt13G0075700 [Buddleja alternifolia]|uniref:Uncharacterized protein n=1 Tax=Buddleja alternifolia TaxID=168488 RepID=A0AAV6WSA7_9LAMI|nr:hypothetical protein BUALT_Bualt13G0075700 [Buddleja alternifolia]